MAGLLRRKNYPGIDQPRNQNNDMTETDCAENPSQHRDDRPYVRLQEAGGAALFPGRGAPRLPLGLPAHAGPAAAGIAGA